ncbi:hypothetical protein ONS95_003766 [Cadophora gregata]|uniref:uncharacterized protein n=1 Tax=Cadophora gregata TaxID=51156 RepID=UPI0026DCC556|nr:uncharacterized protein ONS95_003766 [Cadophora gregata]KAK0107056.1 hypothetical protein ONS95_003766 [Cadophora gregata]
MRLPVAADGWGCHLYKDSKRSHRSKLMISVASPRKSGINKQQLERRKNQTNSSSDHFISPSWYHEARETPTPLGVVDTRVNETEEKVRGPGQDEDGQTSEAMIAMIDATTEGESEAKEERSVRGNDTMEFNAESDLLCGLNLYMTVDSCNRDGVAATMRKERTMRTT